jgi:hypothetical protein
MIPCVSAYTDSFPASACGTATARDRGTGTAERTTPTDVGQLTTGRLAVTGPTMVDDVAVLGLAGPAVDDADDAAPLLTADAPQPTRSVNDASSAAAIGKPSSQPP